MITSEVSKVRSESNGATAPWRSRAFGVDFEGKFPIAGLPPAEEARGGDPTQIEMVPGASLARAWRPEQVSRLRETRTADGRLATAIEWDDKLGYRLVSADWGTYLLSADGRRIRCAPGGIPEWRVGRYLTARLLPLAATLRGLEVFHASAVSLGDAAVAVIGPRGAGKTSVAVHLVLAGAGFMTDDMLALESQANHVCAHPGAGLMGIREAEYDKIPAGKRRLLGRFSRRLEKFYADVARERKALPLAGVYYLDRREVECELEVAELEKPDPRLLLASSYFNRVARTPERLRAQLELCAQLSESAAIFRASIPPSVGASSLAASLMTHATERLGVRAVP